MGLDYRDQRISNFLIDAIVLLTKTDFNQTFSTDGWERKNQFIFTMDDQLHYRKYSEMTEAHQRIWNFLCDVIKESDKQTNIIIQITPNELDLMIGYMVVILKERMNHTITVLRDENGMERHMKQTSISNDEHSMYQTILRQADKVEDVDSTTPIKEIIERFNIMEAKGFYFNSTNRDNEKFVKKFYTDFHRRILIENLGLGIKQIHQGLGKRGNLNEGICYN